MTTPSTPTTSTRPKISTFGVIGIVVLSLGLLLLLAAYLVGMVPPLLGMAVASAGLVLSVVAVVSEAAQLGRAKFGALQIVGVILFALGLVALLLGFSYFIALIIVVVMAVAGLLVNIRPASSAVVAAAAAPLSDRTSTLAVVALVLAFFASVPAVICGHLALAEVARTGERGRGLAIAALWIGYVSIVLSIVSAVIYFVVVFGR